MLFANNGVLLKPQFVKLIKKGSKYQEFEPKILNSSICSKSTLEDLKEMLEGVVERERLRILKQEDLK